MTCHYIIEIQKGQSIYYQHQIMDDLLDYHICNNEDVWLDSFRVTYPKVMYPKGSFYPYLLLLTTTGSKYAFRSLKLFIY